VTPLCGSSVWPNQCGIVRVDGRTTAPPNVAVDACIRASSITCGCDAVDALDEVELVDEDVLLVEDVVVVDEDVPLPDAVPWSLFPGLAGFPWAEAPVTMTATSDTTRARASASFRKAISSP